MFTADLCDASKLTDFILRGIYLCGLKNSCLNSVIQEFRCNFSQHLKAFVLDLICVYIVQAEGNDVAPDIMKSYYKKSVDAFPTDPVKQRGLIRG